MLTCVKYHISKDEWRLREIVSLVHLIEDFGDLRKPTRPSIDKEHLTIWCLTPFTDDGTGNMAGDMNLLTAYRSELKLERYLQRVW